MYVQHIRKHEVIIRSTVTQCARGVCRNSALSLRSEYELLTRNKTHLSMSSSVQMSVGGKDITTALNHELSRFSSIFYKAVSHTFQKLNQYRQQQQYQQMMFNQQFAAAPAARLFSPKKKTTRSSTNSNSNRIPPHAFRRNILRISSTDREFLRCFLLFAATVAGPSADAAGQLGSRHLS